MRETAATLVRQNYHQPLLLGFRRDTPARAQIRCGSVPVLCRWFSFLPIAVLLLPLQYEAVAFRRLLIA
jgi:hypothetical protein